MKRSCKKALRYEGKRWLSILLVTVLGLQTIPKNLYGFSSVFAEEEDIQEEQNNIKMKTQDLMVNNYIGLYVNNAARFSIGTTGGDPNNDKDDNKILLYGYPSSTTSYTTFCIDGSPFEYRGENIAFNTDRGCNTSEQVSGDIHILQTLAFRKNSSTSREDVVEIKYTVTNTGDVDKNIGCRIMFDTNLNRNDKAPFRVPGYGAINTETEFEGEEVPQIWQAFDQLSNPTVIGQGRFYRSEDERPDKVQFANWRRLSNTNWNMPIIPGAGNGDSGVAATWYEKALAPGETREYVTYYGLSELTQDLTGPLILSAYSESELEIKDNAYTPNPFIVNTYVENIGSKAMEDISISLELPEGLSLTDGDIGTIDIGDMKTSDFVQQSWKVKAKESSADQYYKMKIILKYGDGESKSVTRTVYVPALKKKEVPKALKYTLFSNSEEEPLSMYGWQSYVTGDVYTGKDYIYQGSILNVTGKVDTVGTISTNGWNINIDEANETRSAIELPDLDEYIMKKAGETDNYSENKTFSEESIVLDKSIYGEKDISFAGTNFAGNGYIIAEKSIVCGLNQGSTYNDGKIVMYAKQGDITLNGSELAFDGILYAPNGTVYINANIFRLRGRIIAKHIVMNTSQNYIEEDKGDIQYIYDIEGVEEEPEQRGFYEKTYIEEEIAQDITKDGSWTMVCDAGVKDTDWKHVTWNGVRTDDSDIKAEVAVSNDGVNYSDSIIVENGKELEGIKGRYMKVMVNLQKSSSDIMPRLIDVTISTESADLVTNAAPVLNMADTIYKTEMGIPVSVLFQSMDDALGSISSYELSLNTEDEEQISAVNITDVSSIQKDICIQEKGVYNFTAVVTDGQLRSEQIISVEVTDPNEENPDVPGPGGEEQEYTITGQIEQIAFSEDYSGIQIIGSASAEGHMRKYTLSYGLEGSEMQVINESEEETVETLLGEIPTENLEYGNYTILLEVEDEAGNICECRGSFELKEGSVIPGEGDDPSPGEEEPTVSLSEEELNSLIQAKQSAIEWLKAQADEEGSWSRDGLMNKTCEALGVLKIAEDDMESSAYNEWMSKSNDKNIDEQCHAIWGNPNEEAMSLLWEQQNADGGFGLTSSYTSDLYDTLLVLNTEIYMMDLGYTTVDTERLANALEYISSNRHADGGFGYTKNDETRTILTVQYAVILGKLGVSIPDDSTLQDFCTEAYTGDFAKEDFETQAMLARLLQQNEGVEYTKNNMSKILSVQQENGSIYDDVEDTMVFIVLIDEMIKGGE